MTEAGVQPLVWRPDHALVRVARTGLLGVAAAVLAAVAHTHAGGSLPSPALVLGVALLAALACWRASRRRMSVLRCAAVAAGVQATLHLAFTAGAPAAPGHSGALMLIGHVVAGAAFGVWLAVGEAALWRAAGRLAAVTAAALENLAARAALLLAATRSAAPLPRPRTRAPRSLRPAPRPVLRHVVVRRGPPVPAVG
jgi:hypothetical protein